MVSTGHQKGQQCSYSTDHCTLLSFYLYIICCRNWRQLSFSLLSVTGFRIINVLVATPSFNRSATLYQKGQQRSFSTTLLLIRPATLYQKGQQLNSQQDSNAACQQRYILKASNAVSPQTPV